MAQYNEILVGRYNRALQKLLSMKGEPPAAQLAGEISPTLQFFWGVENRYLESWNRFGQANNQGAVAAQSSTIQLRNPPTSNVIIVVEKLLMLSTTSGIQGNISQQAGAADLTTVVAFANQRLDARGGQNPAGIISRQNNAADLGSLIGTYGTSAANASTDFFLMDDQELTILPGDTIRVNTNTVNVNFLVSWIWRERALEESEVK